jgi:hypothetical protein
MLYSIALFSSLGKPDVFFLGFLALTPLAQGLHVVIAISPTLTQGQNVVQGQVWLWKFALGTLELVFKKINEPVGCGEGSTVLSATFVPTSLGSSFFHTAFACKPEKGMTRVLVGGLGGSNERNVTDSTEGHFNFLLASTAFS